MKQYIEITVSFPWKENKSFYKKLLSIGIDEKKHELCKNDGFFQFSWRVYSDDPLRIKSVDLANEAKSVGADLVTIRNKIEYSVADIETSEYLVAGFDVQPKGDTGIEFGTEYDLSAGCPACGCGSTQVSPLRIKLSQLPVNRQLAQSYIQHLMIKEPIAHAIGAELESWNGLRHVEEIKTHKVLPWFQLIPSAVLPRLSSEGCPLIPYPPAFCKTCRRSGYTYDGDPRGFEPVIEIGRAAFKKLPDIVELWENAASRLTLDNMPQPPKGMSKEDAFIKRVIPAPRVCISQRVYQVFKRLKLAKKLDLTPIRFVIT